MERGVLRAAEYVRMSTEHQRYSPANQRAAIGRYAEEHGIEIVRSYEDGGKSGLNIRGRPELRRLLADAASANHGLDALLIFDVSRWGRFQDHDESAHYEYLLRQAGIAVIYVAEPFDNDGSPFASIVKAMKRAMAAEFSRELSEKVTAGHRRLASMGYWQCGFPGFGYRRLLLDADGRPKQKLAKGERKSLQTEHVVIIPGPEEEVDTVREIFAAYCSGMDTLQIAALLNAEKRPLPGRRPYWDYRQVGMMLKNEKYTGANVYGRTSCKLKTGYRKEPQSNWVVVRDAFPPLVPREVWEEAQRQRGILHRHWTDEQYLEALKDLWRRKGKLSKAVIDADPETPSQNAYNERFGGMIRAYALIDYPYEERSAACLPRRMNSRREGLIRHVTNAIRERGADLVMNKENLYLVSTGRTFQIHICRSAKSRKGTRWYFDLRSKFKPDIFAAARLDEENADFLDFYVIPREAIPRERRILLRARNPQYDRYRSRDLEPLYEAVLAPSNGAGLRFDGHKPRAGRPQKIRRSESDL
jgi:DNA invertase Pin-like site-specific DNA recombinase